MAERKGFASDGEAFRLERLRDSFRLDGLEVCTRIRTVQDWAQALKPSHLYSQEARKRAELWKEVWRYKEGGRCVGAIRLSPTNTEYD